VNIWFYKLNFIFRVIQNFYYIFTKWLIKFFFFISILENSDSVRCFHCGIGLRNWEQDDDPWVEHARWSKNCPYVKTKKGQAFIDLVQEAVRKQELVSLY